MQTIDDTVFPAKLRLRCVRVGKAAVRPPIRRHEAEVAGVSGEFLGVRAFLVPVELQVEVRRRVRAVKRLYDGETLGGGALMFISQHELRSQHEYARTETFRIEVERKNLVFRQLELERFFKNRFVVEITNRDAHRTFRAVRP